MWRVEPCLVPSRHATAAQWGASAGWSQLIGASWRCLRSTYITLALAMAGVFMPQMRVNAGNQGFSLALECQQAGIHQHPHGYWLLLLGWLLKGFGHGVTQLDLCFYNGTLIIP